MPQFLIIYETYLLLFKTILYSLSINKNIEAITKGKVNTTLDKHFIYLTKNVYCWYTGYV